MNEIINWVAANNTLMIRTGFTAVTVLIVVYAYRFFFVPKISTVPQAEMDSSDSSLQREMKIQAEEIEKLTSELQLTRQQLEISEKELRNLRDIEYDAASAPAKVTPEPAAAKTEEEKPEPVSAPAASADVTEYLQKIEQLEARLSEYEIIAEDISEISELRRENAELKKKLGDNGAEPAVEAASVSEPEPEVAAEAAAEPAPEPEPEPVSEPEPPVTTAPISETEKEMIDQFEDIAKRKGS